MKNRIVLKVQFLIPKCIWIHYWRVWYSKCCQEMLHFITKESVQRDCSYSLKYDWSQLLYHRSKISCCSVDYCWFLTTKENNDIVLTSKHVLIKSTFCVWAPRVHTIIFWRYNLCSFIWGYSLHKLIKFKWKCRPLLVKMAPVFWAGMFTFTGHRLLINPSMLNMNKILQRRSKKAHIHPSKCAYWHMTFQKPYSCI
jgi:hypothetical protein